MTTEQRLKTEEKVVEMLRTVYDDEIRWIYIRWASCINKIDLNDSGDLTVDMTLTAPNCPMADFILEDVRMKLEHRRRAVGNGKHRIRARVDSGYDERGSQAELGLL